VGMKKRVRSEAIMAAVSPEEKREIERYAANERMSVSEFSRAAVLSYLALRGSSVAWSAIGEGMKALVQEYAGQFVAARKEVVS
jgi:hypothetical protein